MSIISKYKVLNEAKDSFSKEDYKSALDKFSQVLQSFPNSKEAYNGVILSEMAMSGEGGAEALFDYYEILQEEDKEEADNIMSDILQNMDGNLNKLNEIFAEPLKEKLEFENGILYSDFKDILEDDGDFKEIFENIMFSTRVIITNKADFIDFLSKLIENHFTDMALTYLETALVSYPTDKALRKLFIKLTEDNIVEN